MDQRAPVTHPRITARTFPFRIIVRLCWVLALGVLGAGCTRVGSIEWDTKEPLVYHQEATLHVMLKEGWLSRGSVDAMLEDIGPLLVVRKIRETIQPGEVRLTFTVVPVTAGNDLEAFVRYGGDRTSRKSFKLNVEMAEFSGRSNASFLEMSRAPDASVYGSHITMWEGGGDTKYISGHASSNICRKVSAAVTDFAISHALINDEFFVGAGFASLPEDQDAPDRLVREIAALPHPKSLDDTIGEIESDENASTAYDFADLLDEPNSYKPLRPDAEHFRQILRSLAIDSNLQDIVGWIREPESALALIGGSSEFGDVIDVIKTIPPDQRSALAVAIRKYGALLDSDGLLTREFADVANRSGLTRMRPTSAPDMLSLASTVREQSTKWVPGREDSLQALAVRADAVPQGDADGSTDILAMLTGQGDRDSDADEAEAPREGLVFLPFVDATTGKDIIFNVPKILFAPPSSGTAPPSDPVLEMFRKSVVSEMISNLEEAAKREDEYYRTALNVELPRFRAEFAQARDKKQWLHETLDITYDLVNDQGLPTGEQRTEHVSHFKIWTDRLEFAENSRRQAIFYRQSGRRIQEGANDPKAVAVNESALLDSFLRGWDLAFVDNSNESPYRTWLASNRTVVWGAIFKQATTLGLDIAPLMSEQTVFQVRAEGDHYRIRPMYVGEIGTTVVAKSGDGKLVYYRSPWTQRQVVYLKESDVGPGAWTQANAQSHEEKLESALQTLADYILTRAWAEQDSTRQKEGIRQALDVDPGYTANRLIGDYWAMWRESPETAAEQRNFEQVLSEGNRSSAVKALSEVEVRQYVTYVSARAFEGGLRIMRCLAQQSGSLEDDRTLTSTDSNSGMSREAQAKTDVDACFLKIEKNEALALETLRLDSQVTAIRTNLANSAKSWTFNALGRSLASNQINEALTSLAQPLLLKSTTANSAHSSKRSIESYVRLEWYAGDFRSALNLTLGAVSKQVPTSAVLERARLLSDLQMEILKALVYSGMELGSVGEPKLSLASALPSSRIANQRSFFGLRKSNFALRPTSVERIAYRIGFADDSALAASLPEGKPRASTALPELIPLAPRDFTETPFVGSHENSLGTAFGATRTPQGVRDAIWMQEGNQTHAISFSDVIDDKGQSLVVKIASVQPTEANRVVDVLTAAGFELLQGKKLPENFQRAVVLAYLHQVVVVAGDDVLRFGPPPEATNVAQSARDALAKGSVALADLPASQVGLFQEVRYIASQKFDPTTYFSDMQPVPGVVTFSRDGDNLRALVRGPDGILSSVSVQNGQLRQISTGAAAIKDIDRFESLTLARHSDEKVRFLHVSAYDGTANATTHIQVGTANEEIPISELRSLIDRAETATPSLDALFPAPPSGVRPTVIVYRDAFVRGGGRGSGGGVPPTSVAGGDNMPPESRPVQVSWTDDPDRHPMKGVYQKDTEHVAPIPLLLALKDKYPDYRFALDDALDIARATAQNPILVASPKDLAVYLPMRSFRVSLRGVMMNIREQLEEAGIHVEASMKALAERNVLVLSGHKDQALESYLEAHIKAGTLKGKQVVLFSCYQPGDPNLVHRMVTEGGAKEVIFYSDKIEVGAVNEVIEELARALRTQNAAPDAGKPLIDLLDSSVEAVIRRFGTPKVKRDVEVLRGRVPQLSAVMRALVARAV